MKLRTYPYSKYSFKLKDILFFNLKFKQEELEDVHSSDAL